MTAVNPLLLKVKLPGRVFQLPSMGTFYEPGVLAPSVVNGEIQVKPMSALAEMKLRSVDLLFSGRALREVCQECAPEILAPELLISKDVDALFCFLRIVTYGTEMPIKSMHECTPDKTHDYAVNLEQIIMQPNNSSLSSRDLLYRVTLSNGQRVNLKPVTFRDSIDVAHLKQELDTKLIETGEIDIELVQRMVVRDLMAGIKSVEVDQVIDGETKTTVVDDLVMIEEWVRSLQKTYVNAITAQLLLTTDWGFNLTVKLTCKECGEVYDHDLELNPINFFSG